MPSSNVDDRSNPWDDIASNVAVKGTVKEQNPPNQKKGQDQAAKDKAQPSTKEKAANAEAQPNNKGKKGKQAQDDQAAAEVQVVKTPEASAETKKGDNKSKGAKSKDGKQKAEATTAHKAQVQAEVKPTATQAVAVKPVSALARTAMYAVDHTPGGGRVVRRQRGLVMQRPHIPDGTPAVSDRVRLPPLYTLLPCFGQTWQPPPLARLPPYQYAQQQVMAAPVSQRAPVQTAPAQTAPVAAAVEEPKPADPPNKEKKEKKKAKTPPPSSVSSVSSSSSSSSKASSKASSATPVQPVVINIYTSKDQESKAKEAEKPQATPKAKTKKPEAAKKGVKTVKKTVVVAEESDNEEEVAESVVKVVKKVKKVTKVVETSGGEDDKPAPAAKHVKKVKKKVEVFETSDVEEEETPAPVEKVVKKVKKKVEVAESSEEEEPAPAVKVVKRVKKVEVVETSDAEEEAVSIKKKSKRPPTKVTKNSKKVKKIVVEEEIVPAAKAGSTTSASTVSAKSKHSAASSNTSAEAPRPVNSHMQGSGRYEGGKTTTKSAKKDDEKSDPKKDDEKKDLDPYRDTSSINSSQRGKKPDEKKEEPPAGGFQVPFMPGYYPGPMYGAPGPQAWPVGMMPGPAPHSGPAETKKAPSIRDSATTVSDQPAKSSADQAPNLVPATGPPPAGSKKSSEPKSHRSHQPRSYSGSRTPSDLSIHMPYDWRGTIIVKDPATSASKDSPKSDRHVRSRAPSATSRKSVVSDTRTAVLNDAYSPIVEEVQVRLHHHDKPSSHTHTERSHSHNQASSPSPRTQHPTLPDRSRSGSHAGSANKHNQRVWQHPEHSDIFEVYSISTHDGFSPSQRTRDIRPEDSASQVGSRKREGGGRRVVEEITIERTRIVPSSRDVPTGRAETVITSVEGDKGDGSRKSGSKTGAKDGGGAGASYRDHRSEDSRQSRAGSRSGSYRRPKYLAEQDVQAVEEQKLEWDVNDGKAEWDKGPRGDTGPW